MSAPKGNKYAEGNPGRITQTISPETIKEVTQALRVWSQEPETCHLNSFSSKFGKCQTWIYKLADNHPKIKEALEFARGNIAAKMFKNALTNKWNSSFVMKYIGYYDRKLFEYEKEKKAAERANKEKETQNLIVKTISYANALKWN